MWYHILNVLCLRCAHNLCDVPSTPSDMPSMLWSEPSLVMFDHTIICHKGHLPVTHHHSLWWQWDQAMCQNLKCSSAFLQSWPTPKTIQPPSTHPKPTQFNSNLSEKQDQAIEFLMWSSFVFSAFSVLIPIHWVRIQSNILKYFELEIGRQLKLGDTYSLVRLVMPNTEELIFQPLEGL